MESENKTTEPPTSIEVPTAESLHTDSKECELPFDCTVKDYLFDKIPDLSEFIFLQTLIPFGALYIVYIFGDKEIYTMLGKYIVLLFGLRYLYRLLKREPHPTKKNKFNMALSGQFILLILSIFVIADNKMIDLKSFNLFNVEMDLNKIASTLVIFVYGFLKILTRSNYSVDVLNTYFISYFFYHLRIFGN
jgi:hypothetical protein